MNRNTLIQHYGVRLFVSVWLSFAIPAAAADTISVAVAANFHPVLIHIADAFYDSTAHRVLVTSGSTGNLLSQILNGAPFDLFMAADTAALHTLAEKDRIVRSTVTTYAFGKPVVISTVTDSSVSLENALKNADRIAVAQPAVAPYGKAARQILGNMKLWTVLEPRMVYARSVGQSFQFALTGNVPVAFAAYSTLVASGKQFTGVWEIDPSRYAPIEQRLAVIAASSHKETAKAFITFLRNHEIIDLIRSFGYIVPEAG